MVVVICSICGEPADAEAAVCPSCHGRDVRAVPEKDLPPTPDERLLANVHQSVEALAALKRDRAQQLEDGVKERRERALRTRLEGQVGVVEARLRHDREQRDETAYREALDRLKRELGSSL